MPQIKTHIYHNNWREWTGVRINSNSNMSGALAWAKKHIIGNFVVKDNYFHNGPKVIIFENQKEAMRFRLIWG